MAPGRAIRSTPQPLLAYTYLPCQNRLCGVPAPIPGANPGKNDENNPA